MTGNRTQARIVAAMAEENGWLPYESTSYLTCDSCKRDIPNHASHYYHAARRVVLCVRCHHNHVAPREG